MRQTGWEEWQRSFVPARKRFPVILQQNPKRQRHYLKAMRKSGKIFFAQEPGQEVSISYMTGEIKKDGIRHNTEAFSKNPDKPEEKSFGYGNPDKDALWNGRKFPKSG